MNNEATLNTTTISGGVNNVASASNATVGGGVDNEASGVTTTVCGGRDNAAKESTATVSGGFNNTASGSRATVVGGESNTASGNHSFAAGRNATADDDGAFVIGDSTSASIESDQSDEARFQMLVASEDGFIGEPRGEPGTNDLPNNQGMMYVSDGSDDHAEGDLVYAYNDAVTIETDVITAKPTQ